LTQGAPPQYEQQEQQQVPVATTPRVPPMPAPIRRTNATTHGVSALFN